MMEDNFSSPPRPPRITWRRVRQQFLNALDLEKGILYTINQLAYRPGKAMITYLDVDRTKLTPPFRLLLITVAIAATMSISLLDSMQQNNNISRRFEDGQKEQTIETGETSEKTKKDVEIRMVEAQKRLNELYKKYYNITLLCSIPFVSLFTWLFLRQPYNLPEHFVINTYVLSAQTILYILLFPLIMEKPTLGTSIYIITSLVYTIWVFLQIFAKTEGFAWRITIALLLSYLFYVIAIGVFTVVLLVLMFAGKI